MSRIFNGAGILTGFFVLNTIYLELSEAVVLKPEADHCNADERNATQR
jgi:hypothetical protein